MGFLHPELLLLGLPLALAWWRTRDRSPVTLALRGAVALLLLLALAGPYTVTGDDHRDLVVVLDRSRSMPEEGLSSAMELISLAQAQARPGDRVSVVGFGATAAVEHTSADDATFRGFEREVDPDGSDIGAGLETALDLIGEGREGALLLISDGEGNGRDPLSVARRAFARGVRIDVRELRRPEVADLSVERIDLPGEVAVGEPFQFNVWVRSDRRVESELTLRRGDQLLSSGRRVFEPGVSRIVLRDLLEQPGISEYRVELRNDGDRVPENNRGLGAVRARGAPMLLVLNHDGAQDTLVRALRQARIPVVVSTPERARLDAVGLSRYRAVILENVAASRLGGGMPALRDFVLDRGGGLAMTGGRASFGVGGYYRSPIEPLLPVSLELRQEQRRFSVALAIAMDRSGSMSMPVQGNLTKMQLADQGAAAAIELLSPMDEVAVIAVDSSAHHVVSMQPVGDGQAIRSKVLSIESMGGGIFIHAALVGALQELDRSRLVNKHIILFADAADSEEPKDSVAMIEKLHREAGLTLSVIALGTGTDADADLLRELARAGGGDANFTMDPADLPRLFAMDTMKLSRSTFVEETTPVRLLPDLFGLGLVATESFPAVAGYNLTYLRPASTAGMVTVDEYKAPLFAFAHQGLGRSAVYTGQIGGSFGADVARWNGFGEFFTTVARWLMGNEEPEELFAAVRREGRDVVLSVEVDPEAELPPDTSELAAVLSGADGERREAVLERVGEFRFEARYPLDREGVTVGTVHLGDGRLVHLPPVVLPYSPEFERSADPEAGARLLRRLARESGGEVGVTAGGFFRGERRGRTWRLVTRELLIAALVLMVVEIAGRRLSLWQSLRMPRLPRLPGLSRLRLAKRPRRGGEPAEITPDPAPAGEPDATPATPEPAAPPRGSVASALSQARRSADRKLGRQKPGSQ